FTCMYNCHYLHPLPTRRASDLKMTKVAVLSATGMAGHVIALYLEEQGYDVYRMSRSIPPSDKNAQIDASNISELTEWLRRIEPRSEETRLNSSHVTREYTYYRL